MSSHWIGYWILGAVLYTLPTLIAFYRHAESIRSIAALNIFFGWTLIMWFGASVWALVDKPQRLRH